MARRRHRSSPHARLPLLENVIERELSGKRFKDEKPEECFFASGGWEKNLFKGFFPQSPFPKLFTLAPKPGLRLRLWRSSCQSIAKNGYWQRCFFGCLCPLFAAPGIKRQILLCLNLIYSQKLVFVASFFVYIDDRSLFIPFHSHIRSRFTTDLLPSTNNM